MRLNAKRYAALAAAIFMVAGAASCSSDSNENGSDAALPTLDTAATGDIAEHGGARRSGDDRRQMIADSLRDTGAKNVILLIGDGMGDSEITVARDYVHGAAGAFPGIDALPLTGQYTHFSVDKDGKPNYVTDSAASGTAWATGTKSYNGAIGVDITGAPQKSLIESAKAAGKATGDITTSELQDATPAVQLAHVTGRKCYGPEETSEQCPTNALKKGGLGSISEQILTSRADIVMGGGAESFAQTATAGEYAGKTLEQQAKELGFNIVRTADEVNRLDKASQDAPVLGLFADGNMPVRQTGPIATKGGYLEPATTCTENPKRGAQVPKLADMTSKSIDLLKGSDKGFFLQVEGASIDKQDHAADPCGQIGETAYLDDAVKVALDFAEQDKDTLVIVTADHAHTSQIVGNVSAEDITAIAADNKLPEQVVRDTIYPGLTRVLNTKDGAEMTVSYGTSGDPNIESEGHTGTQLRIAGYGPNAADVVGLTDQTDLFFTISRALGLE